MRRTWVLVADATLARLFQMDEEPDDWVLLDEFRGRPRVKNPGRRRVEGHHDDPHAARKAEAERFAHSVASMLHEGVNLQLLDELVLVAAPEFLGLLRRQLSPRVARCVVGTLNRDYAHLTPNQIAQQLTA